MKTSCRFSECSWFGSSEDLLYHCEAYHNIYVKKINSNNGFFFTVNDLLENTFILSAREGIYWFLLDESEQGTYIRRGIFTIDQSNVSVYTVKTNYTTDEKAATYIGPYKTAIKHNQYDLSWCLKSLYHHNSTTCVEVYFGTSDDTDIISDQEGSWTYITEQGIADEDFEPDFRFFDTYNLDKFDCIACFNEELGQYGCPVCTSDIPTNFMLEKPIMGKSVFTDMMDGSTNSTEDRLWKYVEEDEHEYIGITLE